MSSCLATQEPQPSKHKTGDYVFIIRVPFRRISGPSASAGRDRDRPTPATWYITEALNSLLLILHKQATLYQPFADMNTNEEPLGLDIFIQQGSSPMWLQMTIPPTPHLIQRATFEGPSSRFLPLEDPTANTNRGPRPMSPSPCVDEPSTSKQQQQMRRGVQPMAIGLGIMGFDDETIAVFSNMHSMMPQLAPSTEVSARSSRFS